jgi:hypothetical protein
MSWPLAGTELVFARKLTAAGRAEGLSCQLGLVLQVAKVSSNDHGLRFAEAVCVPSFLRQDNKYTRICIPAYAGDYCFFPRKRINACQSCTH